MKTCVLILAMVLGFATSTHAEVVESLSEIFYDVPVQARQTVLSSLNSATPIRQDGKVFHGYTRWGVKWNFRWNDAGGTCRMTSVSVDVSGTITMPRLTGGDATQQAAFDRYAVALKRHELGHFDIGREAAGAIDRALTSLPPMSSCAELEKSANSAASQLLEAHQARERRYDINTEHGRTQGARYELLK
ncbi:MAG: DUF922 domain-containing protein [Betaproteobacteria bacterium]